MPELVETALHSPVEVCLFLFFYSDFVIVSGRGGGFFPFSHKISSFFCFGPYYYAVSRKISFVFPLAFPVTISCFCTKLSGICTKQNIFCTKTGENSGMFFQHFRDLFMRIADFFAFFSWLFRWKNPFFLTRPSVNDRIYSYRPYIFHAFFGWFDKFFSFFSRAFLYFSVRLRKNLLFFFHPDRPFFETFFASSE